MILNLFKVWIINLPFKLLSRKCFLGEIKMIDIHSIFCKKAFFYLKLIFEGSRPLIYKKYLNLKLKEYLSKKT